MITTRKKNKKAWTEKLLDLEGYDTITVDQFLDSLPDFQEFYKNIKKINNYS